MLSKKIRGIVIFAAPAAVANSLGSQLGGGIEDGTDDLVVAGAPAEVAGEPVARLGLRRIRITVQQRLGSDQQARRAEAALQRRMFQEFSLQRMQIVPARHALDGLDLVASCLDRKHQARADQAAVDRHAAGATVARAAPLLAAGQMQLITQDVEQRELRLAQKLRGLAVNDGRYVMLAHRRSPARSKAIVAVRRANTPATLVRYSIVPRLSSIGLQACRAAWSSPASAVSSSLRPTNAAAASGTRIAVGATAPSTTRASAQIPPASSVRLTAAPTTAMSISVRGMKRR